MSSIFDLYCKHIISSIRPNPFVYFHRRYANGELIDEPMYTMDDKLEIVDKMLTAHGLATLSGRQISSRNFEKLVSMINEYIETVNCSIDGFIPPREIENQILRIKSFCKKIE
jgi:hypothetical protein